MIATSPHKTLIRSIAGLRLASLAPLEDGADMATRRRLSRSDRLCGLALRAALLVYEKSSLAPAMRSGDRTAIVFASTYGSHATNLAHYMGLVEQGLLGVSPRLFAYTLSSSPVGELALALKISGSSLATLTGPAAGLFGVAAAQRELGSDRCDRVLLVSADVALHPSDQDRACALLLENAAADRESSTAAELLGCAATFSIDEADFTRAILRLLSSENISPAQISTTITTDQNTDLLRKLGVSGQIYRLSDSFIAADPLIALASQIDKALVSRRENTFVLVAVQQLDGCQAAALFRLPRNP